MIYELRQKKRPLRVYGRSMIEALWLGSCALGLPLEELDAVPTAFPNEKGNTDERQTPSE